MWNNSDKFDHLISLAAMQCVDEEVRELESIDTSSVSFDKAYYRKKSKVIRQEKRKPYVKAAKVFLVKAAVLLMALLTLVCVLIGCVPGLRRAIFDAVFGWYEEYFTVRYEDPSGLERETEIETETEAVIVAPTYIAEIRKPRDLSEGVWEDVVLQNTAKNMIDYYIGEQYLFSFSQFVIKPSDKYVDNEGTKVSYVDINGHAATVVEYTDKNEVNILWSDEEYSYHIFTTECDVETLLEYAKSVE